MAIPEPGTVRASRDVDAGPGAPSTRIPWMVALAVTLLLGGFGFVLQFQVTGLVDSDSYFHVAFAERMGEHGLSRHFEPTTFSTWRDGFADYNLVSHLWLAPFASGLGIPGAKAANAFLLAVALGLLATFSVRHRLRGGILWSVLVLAIGWHVLFRLLPARPHVMSLVLFLVWLEGYVADRHKTMAVSGFLLAWNHFSAPLVVVLAAAGTVASMLPGRFHPTRRSFVSLAWTAAGVGAGYVVNPYFPNNLVQAFDGIVVMFGQLFGESAIPVGVFGQEFAPVSSRSLLVHHLTPLLWVGALLLPFAASRHMLAERSIRALAVFGMAAVMGMLSSRFLHEITIPVAYVTGALLTDDLLRSTGLTPRWRRTTVVAALVSVVVAAQSLVAGWPELARYRTQEVYRPAVERLRAVAPDGAQVFHLGIGDFNVLYHVAPELRYVAALDPMFVRAHDRRVFDTWLAITTQRSPDPVRDIREVFRADYVFVRKARGIDRLFAQHLSARGDVTRIHEDEFAAVYALR